MIKLIHLSGPSLSSNLRYTNALSLQFHLDKGFFVIEIERIYSVHLSMKFYSCESHYIRRFLALTQFEFAVIVVISTLNI